MTDEQARELRDRQLRSYYSNEVRARAERALAPDRESRRDSFVELLRREGRSSIVEVGCGTGQDALAFAEASLGYTGIDLTPASVAHCRALGLDAHVGSALALPLGDHQFDAGWTMSTLMHLDPADQPLALAELARVLRPGAPLAIGLWGADESTEEEDETEFGTRYFARSDDATIMRRLETIGTVESFETTAHDKGQIHYQFAVVRVAGTA